jgi:hypothetical protein
MLIIHGNSRFTHTWRSNESIAALPLLILGRKKTGSTEEERYRDSKQIGGGLQRTKQKTNSINSRKARSEIDVCQESLPGLLIDVQGRAVPHVACLPILERERLCTLVMEGMAGRARQRFSKFWKCGGGERETHIDGGGGHTRAQPRTLFTGRGETGRFD